MNLEENRDTYLHLHADCIPVKGAMRSAIYDLTRNELIFFPSEYFEVLEYLTSDKIGNVMDDLECEEERKLALEFIDFLKENELVAFLENPSMFPAIEEKWDTPSIIQNAIIDVDEVLHDFDKIFRELDELGCQFVQIRSFSGLLKLEELHRILTFSHHKSIQSVELIIKYDREIGDEGYIGFIEDHPILSHLTIHSSPEEKILEIDYGCDKETSRYIKKEIQLVCELIDSQVHCGMISIRSLNLPVVDSFFETKLHNGCLNRKVAIDKLGEIKNCPSMTRSYGNTKNTSLEMAINITGFKEIWNITKDQINICRDCEFRYVCSDCRAYVEDPADIFSKPLKCGYNPYTCEWEEWSENPLKQYAIGYYGMKKLGEKEKNNESIIPVQSI